jgi:hypothetical protein
LTIPYIFTQDDLLTTSDFLAEAKARGYELTIDNLQELHTLRLLVPLYRVTDTAVAGRRIPVSYLGGMNPRGWVMEAANDGRLRDSFEEGYSISWPYRRPSYEKDRWWNGFIYSSWQLLDVGSAIDRLRFIRFGSRSRSYAQLARSHKRNLALAALSTRFLPGVLGRLRFPPGTDEESLREYRASSRTNELVEIAGLDLADLETNADNLLIQAHNEPLAKWLPLVRYASYEAWFKLRGAPLDAIWRRIAAEVLLRAHEDLAANGLIAPLEDLSGSAFWSCQHDRLTPRYAEAQTLERALAELGLSPHPRVILLVEGDTELLHMTRLLPEFGIAHPESVRVQVTTSSKVNPHLIARYGVTPRIGRKLQDRWMLDASPTALMIVMDPENDFATQAQRDNVRLKLQRAIRDEVRYQDAEIAQADLDQLVHVRVWGDDKYELANFSNDELVPAITSLAVAQQSPRTSMPTWEVDVRAELDAARVAHHDIKVPLGRLRIREDKVELARLLWPTLRSKCEAEYVAGSVQTPILQIVLEVRALVARVSGVFALEAPQ